MTEREASIRGRLSSSSQLVPAGLLRPVIVPTVQAVTRDNAWPILFSGWPTPSFLEAERHLYTSARTLNRTRDAARRARQHTPQQRADLIKGKGPTEIITAYSAGRRIYHPDLSLTGECQSDELESMMTGRYRNHTISNGFLTYASEQAETVLCLLDLHDVGSESFLRSRPTALLNAVVERMYGKARRA